MSKNRWLLQELAAPLAKRPINEIMPAEILIILKRIEKSGRRETARRLRGAIGTVFRFAITILRATMIRHCSSRSALETRSFKHRPAIIDEVRFGALMVSIDEYDGWPTIRAALQLIALTMTRTDGNTPHASLGNHLAQRNLAHSCGAHEDATSA